MWNTFKVSFHLLVSYTEKEFTSFSFARQQSVHHSSTLSVSVQALLELLDVNQRSAGIILQAFFMSLMLPLAWGALCSFCIVFFTFMTRVWSCPTAESLGNTANFYVFFFSHFLSQSWDSRLLVYFAIATLNGFSLSFVLIRSLICVSWEGAITFLVCSC